MMGVYLLTEQTFNSFLVYEKAGGGKFLYVSDNGYWGIGRYVYCLPHQDNFLNFFFVLASYIQLVGVFIIQRKIPLPPHHPSQDGNTLMMDGSMMNNSL